MAVGREVWEAFGAAAPDEGGGSYADESGLRRRVALSPAEQADNLARERSPAAQAELSAAIEQAPHPTARAALEETYRKDFGSAPRPAVQPASDVPEDVWAAFGATPEKKAPPPTGRRGNWTTLTPPVIGGSEADGGRSDSAAKSALDFVKDSVLTVLGLEGQSESRGGDYGRALGTGVQVAIPEAAVGLSAATRESGVQFPILAPLKWLASAISPVAQKDAAADAEANTLRKLQARRERIQSSMTAQGRESKKKEFFDDDAAWTNISKDGLASAAGKVVDLIRSGKFFGEAWSDPDKMLMSTIESAPMSIGMMLPAVRAARYSYATTLERAMAQGASREAAESLARKAAERSAMAVGGAGEGVTGAGSQFAQTYNEVMGLPQNALESHPEYRRILDSMPDSLPLDERQARARETVARAAGTTAAAIAGVADTLLGGLGDRFIGSAVAGKGGRAAAVGRGFGQEAISESAQSGAEQFGTNLGVRQNADLTRGLATGVGESAVEGGISGGIMGGVVGGAVYRGGGAAGAGADPGAATGPVQADELLGRPADTAARRGDASIMDEESRARVLSPSVNDPALTERRIADIDEMLKAFASPEHPDAAALIEERDQLAGSLVPRVSGQQTAFTTESGARIEANFALVEASDLAASHRPDMQPNPNYPAALQPRDRTRAASDLQVAKIAGNLAPERLGESGDAGTGAPIIGADGLVESGNARTIAIQRAYAQNGPQVARYREWITANASRFGIDPDAAASMRAPVLVRVRSTPVNRVEFAQQANQASVAQMSPSELARTDAARMGSLDNLTITDDGEFMVPANDGIIRGFFRNLPITEQAALVDANGRVSQAGYARFRNALLAKAYGNNPVVAKLSESMSPLLRNLTNALIRMAPMIAKAKEAMQQGAIADRDITDNIVRAVDELVRMRQEGRSLAQVLAQSAMFADLTPETIALMEFLDENVRSPAKIGEFIAAYLGELERYGSASQGDMFGGVEVPGRADLIQTARGKVTPNGEAESQATPVQPAQGGAGVRGGTEAAPEPSPAEAAGTGDQRPAEVPGPAAAGDERADQPGGGGTGAQGTGAGAGGVAPAGGQISPTAESKPTKPTKPTKEKPAKAEKPLPDPAPLSDSPEENVRRLRERLAMDKQFRAAFKEPEGADSPDINSPVAMTFFSGYLDGIAERPLDMKRVSKPSSEMRPGGFNPVDAYRSGYESAKRGAPARIRVLDNAELFGDQAPAGENPETPSVSPNSSAAPAQAPAAPESTPSKSPDLNVEADRPSAEAQAQADLDAALGDLGDLLGKGGRLNITPEQEQKLVPILTRLFDAGFRLGYHKFKRAAKFVLDTIRAKLGAEVADQITIEHLQGAYIGMSGKYREQGAEPARDVVQVESIAAIEAPDAPAAAPEPAPAPSPVDEAAHTAATSPQSDAPLPTDGQKDAGNYPKGHVRLSGLDISIENPEGSVRSGVDRDGKRWEIKMRSHYGYIRGTVGKDKDHLDVFIRPGTPTDYEGAVWIIDQNNADGSFDEHKIMVGWANWEDAREAYLANYTKGWESRIRGNAGWTMERFRTWLKTGDTKAPVSVDTSALKAAGLEIVSATTKNGNPVWEVGGNTRAHSDMLKRLGGRWYGPKKVWSFYKEDPTAAIVAALGGKPAAAAPTVAPESESTPATSPAPVLGIARRWDQATPAERREFLRAAGYTDNDQARVLSGTPWNQLGESVRKAVDKAIRGTKVDAASPVPAHQQIAEWVKARLHLGQPFSSSDLFSVADREFGGTQAEGKYTPKDAYDALELGVNQFLKFWARADPTTPTATGARVQMEILAKLMGRIPSQTKRTQEQDEFQQFSTPPTYAFLANWVANITAKDVYLEPSGGIGGLAVFGKNAGATVIVNEFSARRAEILRAMGFDRVFTENAEQLHNVLPDDVRPTVVVMNPPFSATAGRIPGQRDFMNGARHIDQALRRLEPGGRLVAIMGKGRHDESAAWNDWISGVKESYSLRADVVIDGKEYAKYGTTFDVRIMVFDKDGKVGGSDRPVRGEFATPADALDALEGVRNDRPKGAGANLPVQSGATQQARPGNAQGGGAGAGTGRPAPAATPPVGDRQPGSRPGPNAGTSGSVGATQPDAVSGQGGAGVSTPDGGRPVGGNVDGQVRADQQPEGSSGSPGAPVGQPDTGLSVAAGEEAAKADLTESVFESYAPQRLTIPGAKPHPGKLVQSSAMASVSPPAPTYTPNLPKSVIENGDLSLAQLESVVYAGQAHSQILPAGDRMGFFIGDGTGVGKGREIAGIILDNWRQGRHRAVWISEKAGLFKDARRDFSGIGGRPEVLFRQAATKYGDAIKGTSGILFTTYATLRQNKQKAAQKKGKQVEFSKSRLDQIVEWLGADFDGVIVFDEAHNMGNAVAMRGSRGVEQPSEQALAGVELQNRLPQARVVYVSATGATEVSNLSYAGRLGLWGDATPFANVGDFINAIQNGGLSGMELVARDMKQLGAYLARSLSFDGVTYSRLEHPLTSLQRDIYNELARSWQIVLLRVNEALELTGAYSQKPGGAKDGKARASALSAFWGAHQRFFNQIITSMQMPAVIEQLHKDLDAGEAAVLQLVNTNEAIQNRQLASMGEDETLEDLDLTPRENLVQYIMNSFPIIQYEVYTDDEGNKRNRPVRDSQGNHVISKEAVAARDALLQTLTDIRVPDGPLEIILNEFGAEQVAEVTGRGKRVLRVKDKDGSEKVVVEKRAGSAAQADAEAFLDDRKRILVFSDAGGTGFSFHADLTKKNQRKRKHYLIQPGWRADKAVQGFGRTHRTNQKSEPHYYLVTTDLLAQKRFISSIARRLDQLGALTKGQRDTANQGLFSAKDNLESSYAEDAVMDFFRQMHAGRIPGFNFQETARMLGFDNLTDPKTGALVVSKIPHVPQFLNRLLSLETTEQERVFNEFASRMEAKIDQAIANGTLDAGMQTIKGQAVRVKSEEVVHSDKRTGAETKYVELELEHPTRFVDFDAFAKRAGVRWMQNIASGKVWAVMPGGRHTRKDGAVVDRLYLQSTGSARYEEAAAVTPDKFKALDEAAARALWDQENAARPKTFTEPLHMVVGSLLPVWDRMPGFIRVARTQTDDGRRYLGRVIHPNDLKETLKRLGATSPAAKMTPAEVMAAVMNDGRIAELANGWKLMRRRVSNENRMEINLGRYPSDSLLRELKRAGAFVERIQYAERVFIPVGQVDVLERIIASRPVVDLVGSAEKGADGSSPLLSRSGDDIRFAANVLTELAATDEVFRYPVSKSSDLQSVFEEVMPAAEFLGNATRPEEDRDSGADRRFMFRTNTGRDFYVYERGRDVWIDVSALEQGEGGAQIYAAVLNYAHNAKKRLIGDPKGLSVDAIIRRTSAMLSSALRFGTTRHMAAATEQMAGDPDARIAPLRWGGSDAENVRNLIDSFLETLYARVPELKGMRYDFGRQQFIGSDGARVRQEDFERLAKEAGPRDARAGEGTLRRGALLQSLVSSEAGQRPGILQAVLARAASLASQGDLRGIFSRQPATETPADAGVSLSAARNVIYQAVGQINNVPSGGVMAVEVADELPEHLRDYLLSQNAADDTEGLYDPRTDAIYLIARNIDSAERAQFVLFHELFGHYGLRGLFGNRLNAELEMIAVRNPNIRAAAAKKREQFGYGTHLAIEEAMSDLAGEGRPFSGLKQFMAAVQRALRAIGLESVADVLERMTDAEAMAVLATARAWVEAGDRPHVYSARTMPALNRVDSSQFSKQEANAAIDIKAVAAKRGSRHDAISLPYGDKFAVVIDGRVVDVAETASEAEETVGFMDSEFWRGEFESFPERWPRWARDGSAPLFSRRAPAVPAVQPAAVPAAPAPYGVRVRAKPREGLLNRAVRAPMQALGGARLARSTVDLALRVGGWVGERATPIVTFGSATWEDVKAGVVDKYGLDEAVLDRRAQMYGRQAVQLRGVKNLLDQMATLTRAEAAVLYRAATTADPTEVEEMISGLDENSQSALRTIKQTVRDLGSEAVRLKLMTDETFRRNEWAYLHRSYLRHELEDSAAGKASRARRIQILGDHYKHRGLIDWADPKKIANIAPDFWGRKVVPGRPDYGLKDQKFIRLERRKNRGDGVMVLDGIEEANQRGRLLEVLYWPAGEPIPARFGSWDQAGTWQARFFGERGRGGAIGMWRDFTADERKQMGEIDDIRYAFAKTMHNAVHNVEVGNYLLWLSDTHAVPNEDDVPAGGTLVERDESALSGLRRVFRPDEWVRVPETRTGKHGPYKYGALAGKIVPGPIWNDVRQVVNHRWGPEWWNTLLRAWKISKTALSPAVHMNNIMANVVMADWHDVSPVHVLRAFEVLVRSDRPEYRRLIDQFEDHGGTQGMYMLSELQREQMEPILDQLRNDLAGSANGAAVGMGAALQALLARQYRQAWAALRESKAGAAAKWPVQKLIDLYQAEDTVFRLAAFLKVLEEGGTPAQAGKFARRSFLDYDINAPWIQAMRNSAFPFISFTYRAVPMLIEVIRERPWKLAKLALIMGAINAAGYLMSGGDEDKERKLLPEEKAGKVLGFLGPKLIRMPWNDKHGSPVFLDVRRWMPLGDFFDVGQTHAAIPILPAAVPGGPLALLAELVFNKSQFTGKPITKETDTGGEVAGKVADHLYKAFAPNLPMLPGTYSSTAIVNAGSGRTDAFGREQSVGQALASSVGVKLGSYPADVAVRNLSAQHAGKVREIGENISALRREYEQKGISREEFEKRMAEQVAKRVQLQRELAAKIGQ